MAVPGQAHEILDGLSPTLSDCPLIEKTVNLEGLVFVSDILHQDRGGLLWAGALERVFGRF